MIQKQRQGGGEHGPAHLERGRRLRLTEDGDRGAVQLEATRCLGRTHHGALDLDDRLREERRRSGPGRFLLDDDLGDPTDIAQQQERQLGEVALVMNPPGESHPFADAGLKRRCHRSLHRTSRVDRPWVVRAGGCPTVPPHFTAASSGLVRCRQLGGASPSALFDHSTD